MRTEQARERIPESGFIPPLPSKRAQLKAVALAAANETPLPTTTAKPADRPTIDTPGFKIVRDDFMTGTDGGVRWGWKQWIAIAPDVRKHLDKVGRTKLAAAVDKAQRKHLPKEQRRELKSLGVACSPTATFDIGACVRFITDHPDPQALIGFSSYMPPRRTSTRTTQAKPETTPTIEQAPEPVPHKRQARELTNEERRQIQRDKKRLWRAEQKAKLQASAAAHAQSYQGRAQDARDARADEDKREEHRRWEEGRIGPINTPEERDAAKARQKRAKPQTVSTHQPAHDDALQGFLATPIGIFVPSLKAFMRETLSELFKPHHALIAETVRAAVIDVVGAPTPPEAKAEAPPAATATTSEPLDFEIDTSAPNESALIATEQQPASEPAAAKDVREETSDEIALRDALAHAPHDLESQLALAARALDIPTPGKKESIILVNFQPKIEHEIEKFYGRAFRFVFKRSHNFVGSADLPPSTDGVILCKHRLTNELVGLTRRYAIPVQHSPNTSNGVLWALKQMFPESAESLNEIRH